MGLDSVELVLAFEEEFGIAIPDSAAENMRTPRDVIDFVVKERQRVAELDAMKHLLETLGEMGFADIRPDMSFNELFGSQRVIRWKELGKRLAPFSIPRDVPHGPGCAMAGWSFLAGAIALFMGRWLLAGICVLLFAVGWIWSGRTRRIPDSVDSVEKLAAHLTRPFSESEIAEKVRAIVTEQLELKEGVYGEDKRFVQDLGVD
ncbi:MAG: phosphopantetheine-binding protein [Verrucomicrobiaceae bacterium]